MLQLKSLNVLAKLCKLMFVHLLLRSHVLLVRIKLKNLVLLHIDDLGFLHLQPFVFLLDSLL